jgi:secretion/DNA translocation related CpaE-like protein
MAPARTGSSRRPLLVTKDPLLRDEVLRVALGVGVEVDVAPDLWSLGMTPGSTVLLGSDVAGSGSEAALAGVPQVAVVTLTSVATATALAEPSVQAVALGLRLFRLPADTSELCALLMSAATVRRPSVVAVVGGRGGAGATVLSCALAVTAAASRGAEVLVVDADPLGGGIDLTMGAEAESGLRWPDVAGVRGAVPPEQLLDHLPRVLGVRLLAHARGSTPPVGPDAMQAVLAAAVRGCDLVVVDAGRVADAAAEVALSLASRAYVVVPADVRGVAAATSTAARVRDHCADVALVLRRSGPAGVNAVSVAELVGAPVVAELRKEAGLAGRLERGVPPAAGGRGSLAVAGRRLLGLLDGGTVTASVGRAA